LARAVALVTEIYSQTSTFPDAERFGLSNQMRRAAVSIASNIAEGSARHHSKDFIHFLRMADGSAAELETQLIISCKLGFITDVESLLNDTVVIRRMLAALIKSLGT
jgi:four helix bundle protein